MAIVITGATGHIGNNLLRLLLEEEKEVRIIIRKDDEAVRDLNPVKIYGDFYEPEVLKKSIFKCDIVIHLAAVIELKNHHRDAVMNVNLEGTKAIARYAYQVGVKQFIFASSVDAMYKEKGDDPVYEKDYLDTSHFKDVYPLSKALSTNWLIDFQKDHPDFHLAIVYPSAVFGINDYKPSSIGKVIKDAVSGKMEFGIKGGYNFVNVRDVAKAIAEIIAREKEGSYLLTGERHSVMELYDCINIVLGKKRFKLELPTFVAYLAMPFTPYLSPMVIRIIHENPDYRNDKAIKDLDYQPEPFLETVKETVLWFEERK